MHLKLKEATDYIRLKSEIKPRVGIVLGSGLGHFVNSIEDQTSIEYENIPYFHQTTVEGHAGRLIMGHIKGVPIAVLQGRLHVYEGHEMEDIVFPVRVLAMLGIENLILTNAAGGINTSYKPGDLVVIEDHINLMGKNPLIGPNVAELGPRFPDMTEAYCKEIKTIFHAADKKLGTGLRKGVYCALTGPTYETPAEIKMLRVLGADMVGMSTVPEAIAANHLGLRVGGISCVTNMAAGIENVKLSHDDVKKQATLVMDKFTNLLKESVALM